MNKHYLQVLSLLLALSAAFTPHMVMADPLEGDNCVNTCDSKAKECTKKALGDRPDEIRCEQINLQCKQECNKNFGKEKTKETEQKK